VLVVDDSALMRKMIADLLRAAPDVEVVGSARDGDEAVELAGKLKPDVVTLDVEMPVKSGLDALPEILEVCPVPVVMVSALTQEGADVTLAALELGAFDFMPKPGGPRGLAELRAVGEQLVAKVRSAAQGRVRRPRAAALAPRPRPRERPPVGTSGIGCVALGISTGGPQALTQALPSLKSPIPPVVIVQHMPAQFMSTFAARLARRCAVPVKEAEDGERLVPDVILVAPGGRHAVLVGRPPLVRVSLADTPPVNGFRPSIDVLFQSVARVYGTSAAAILMTGMGRDGVEGCKRVREAGGATFAQDEATSAVFGMNKAALQEGAIQHEFALDDLPELIERLGRPA
jgi:two-component system chemotaxis response regulator CheB